MRQRKSRQSSSKPTLEMTPMIDVVFQLLIFFIVTLKPLDVLANLDALRPQPDSRPHDDPKEPLTIVISPEGFSIDGMRATERELENRLARYARQDINTTVVIKCMDKSKHGNLVRALDICSKLGMRKLAVFSF